MHPKEIDYLAYPLYYMIAAVFDTIVALHSIWYLFLGLHELANY